MRAFCPGHVTGFFTVEDSDPNPLRRGSRGAGFCIRDGAVADVRVSKGSGDVVIRIDGRVASAPVTQTAIQRLLPEGCDVDIDLEIAMPVRQGFGMSAAGTFASCLGLVSELGFDEPKRVALEATHLSEVEQRTGLGDAVAQSSGGFVFRSRAGIPPLGQAEGFDTDRDEVVFCLLGEGLDTSLIIGDVEKQELITKVGHSCVNGFGVKPNLRRFLTFSRRFAYETGLMSNEGVRSLKAVENIGEGSMVMLGNAIFAFGNPEELEPALRPFGRVLRTVISDTGARVL